MVAPGLDGDHGQQRRFAEPWTEARVRALLVPVVGKGHELVCRERPQEKS